jgi:putative tryptophan/tyrosine transport system substrate-binding protein
MQSHQLKRREFITLLGGAAAVWPFAARAQQGERMRRIGALMSVAADDPEAPARVGAFSQGLSELGWTIGRNVRIDYRWYAANADLARKYAAELVALAPDIILASGTVGVTALQQVARSVPIVFTLVADPVGAGIVASLAQPGGDATGFMLYEYSLSGKWLELLKQIAPRMTRAVVLRERTNPAGIAQFGVIQALAPSLGVQVSPLNVRNADEIESGIATFARTANGGLVVTGTASATAHLITKLAAQYKLPAIYANRVIVTGGGLIGYGPDRVDQYRRAAGYVDRILKGEKPADLPVQAPIKYELVVNLKTAKTLGIDIPTSVLATADEVIE